jgi:hypothetical protein
MGTYRWNWWHTPTNTLASIVLLRAPNQLVGRLHIVYIRVSLYDDIMESIGGWSHHTHTSPWTSSDRSSLPGGDFKVCIALGHCDGLTTHLHEQGSSSNYAQSYIQAHAVEMSDTNLGSR